MAALTTSGDRQAQLAAGLEAVERRIATACRDAGRARAEVTLVVVTKTYPATDVALLRELGVTDVGENRDQEAAPKAAAVPGVRWHFVGQLQSNKAASVASYSHVVHSVDRPSVVSALDRGADVAGRFVDVLVQVSLDADPNRGGVLVTDVRRLAELVAAAPRLRLKGVMAVAPLGVDPLSAFARLAEVAADLRSDHAEAGVISAGMSGDLEEAIAAGATHVRVGSAILGARDPLLG